MTAIPQHQTTFYEALVDELTERDGAAIVSRPAEAANDARFEAPARSRQRAVGVAVATVAALAASAAGPFATAGALALLATLAVPMLAIEHGNPTLLGAGLAAGILATGAAYALPVGLATAATAAIAATLALLVRRTLRD